MIVPCRYSFVTIRIPITATNSVPKLAAWASVSAGSSSPLSTEPEPTNPATAAALIRTVPSSRTYERADRPHLHEL